MMMTMSLIKRLSEEANISEELAEEVVSNFWNTIRYFLANPFVSKNGIGITSFGRFEVNMKRIYAILLHKADKMPERAVLYYKELFKYVMENEKDKNTNNQRMYDKLKEQNKI